MSKIELLMEYKKETGKRIDFMDLDDAQDVSENPEEFIDFMKFLIEKIEGQDGVLDLLTEDYRDFEGCACGCNEMEEL